MAPSRAPPATENDAAVARIRPQNAPVPILMLKPGCFSRLGVLGNLSEINSPTAPRENSPTANLLPTKETQRVSERRCNIANQQTIAIGDRALRPESTPIAKIAATTSTVDINILPSF